MGTVAVHPSYSSSVQHSDTVSLKIFWIPAGQFLLVDVQSESWYLVHDRVNLHPHFLGVGYPISSSAHLSYIVD
jgi:hypothetical protein